MVEKILPIGSVVRLNGGIKRLMIFGILQKNGDDDGTEYDYVGVAYPEGSIGMESHFLFNDADIEEIVFRGYEDIERQTFINILEEALKSQKAK